MSEHDHHHPQPGAGGEGYEEDMTGSAAGVVFLYIAVLSVGFFATVGALYMYFRYEADAELQRKVYSVESEDLKKLRAEEAAALQGKIDAAMKTVVQESKAQ